VTKTANNSAAQANLQTALTGADTLYTARNLTLQQSLGRIDVWRFDDHGHRHRVDLCHSYLFVIKSNVIAPYCSRLFTGHLLRRGQE